MTARRSRPRWLAGLALAALCVLLAGGFVRFLAAARAGAQAQAGPPPRADGIVALTGGAERIAAALRLLAAGRGRLLLVSGVGGETGFTALARRAGADPALRSRVSLGHLAASTRGNAQETAAWAQAHGIASLIVVTAWYHMPRALAELSRALPEVRLYPVAVSPPTPGGLPGLRLLGGEYAKWLLAEAGLSGLGGVGDLAGPAAPVPRTALAPVEGAERIVRLGG